MHDGAAYNRTEKVKEIIAWPAAVKNLRVCWQGILQDKNCGQCEKCIRTQLNFLATGNPIPEAFSKKIDVDIDLENYSIKGNIACAEWNQMLTYARAHQVDGKWLLHVERIIKNGCC